MFARKEFNPPRALYSLLTIVVINLCPIMLWSYFSECGRLVKELRIKKIKKRLTTIYLVGELKDIHCFQYLGGFKITRNIFMRASVYENL